MFLWCLLHVLGVIVLLNRQDYWFHLKLLCPQAASLFCAVISRSLVILTLCIIFQHSTRGFASALYSQAAVGGFLISKECMKGGDNQLPLNCFYPFLSYRSITLHPFQWQSCTCLAVDQLNSDTQNTYYLFLLLYFPRQRICLRKQFSKLQHNICVWMNLTFHRRIMWNRANINVSLYLCIYF